MKNRIPSFDEFLNEKKDLSPANVKLYNANKNSINALKTWTYKIKDFTVAFKDLEYWGSDSDFFEFINGESNTIYYMSMNINDSTSNVNLSKSKESKISVDGRSNRLYFDITETEFSRYIAGNEDRVLGFVNLLNYLFEKYSNDIYTFANDKFSLETLYVINAGKIAPATGKNAHGWSIYDYPKTQMAFIKGSTMVLWGASGFQVGQKFKILDDQTHKLISHEVTIEHIITANYNDFIKYSKIRGAEIPVAAFQKQPGRFRFELYSVK